MAEKIELYVENGKLKVDKPCLGTNRCKKIKWKIRAGEKHIGSFYFSTKYGSDPEFFVGGINNKKEKEKNHTVLPLVAIGREWAYNIHWFDEKGNEQEVYDPIIVIDPTYKGNKKIILAAIGTIIAACIPLVIKYIKRRLK